MCAGRKDILTSIIAHRGASDRRPENTMSAFRQAVTDGADAIETDVQLSKDGVPVLIHDTLLKRTTGASGSVHEYTYKELQDLSAGAWMHKRYRKEKIVSLERLLQEPSIEKTRLVLELKNSNIAHEGLEEAVISLLNNYEKIETATVSSFNHRSMAYARELSEEINIAILYAVHLYRPCEYAKIVGATELHPHYRTIDKSWIDDAINEELEVVPYTIDKKSGWKKAIDAGVTGIITNKPKALQQYLYPPEKAPPKEPEPSEQTEPSKPSEPAHQKEPSKE